MLTAPHDLSPCLRPGDEATHLGGMPWEDRTGRSRWAEFYLVLHRAGGAWTHLYRVLPGVRLELVLVRAVEGDARAALQGAFFADGARRFRKKPPAAGATGSRPLS